MINASIRTFEVSQAGFAGMYINIVAVFIGLFAITMLIHLSAISMQSPIVVMNPAAAKCHLFLTEVYDGIILSTRPNSDHGNGAWLGISRGFCASGCCDPYDRTCRDCWLFAAGDSSVYFHSGGL